MLMELLDPFGEHFSFSCTDSLQDQGSIAIEEEELA